MPDSPVFLDMYFIIGRRKYLYVDVPAFLPLTPVSVYVTPVYVNSLLAALNMRSTLRQNSSHAPVSVTPMMVFKERADLSGSSGVGSGEVSLSS
jgi:hypothetical protein